MAYGANVGKNAAMLIFATAGQKVAAFLAFIVVARLIGREQTGVFFYAVSITSIFVTFSDLGMTPVVIRAVAGNKENGGHLLGASLRMKLVLAPLAIIGALLYAWMFQASSVVLAPLAIACLVMTADTIHLALYGVLRGRQNLRPEAFGMFIGQILTAGASVAAAWFGSGPIGLTLALLAGSTWNVLWSAMQMRRLEVHISRPRHFDYAQLLREAIPFGLAGIAVKVYSYVDSLFLQQYHGASEVGNYAVAYKLTYALQFLPLTFSAALYPALASAFAKGEEDDIRYTFLGSLRLMAAVSFPLAAGLSALAPRLIALLYGDDFFGASRSLQILPWVLIPIFLDFPIGSLLNATHRAHMKTTAMLATMIANVALNAILVPRMGSEGAAIAGVISFCALYLMGAAFSHAVIQRPWALVSLTVRALVSAAVSWVAWYSVGGFMVLPAAMVFGGAVAVVMAFMTRLVTVDDVYSLIRHFRPLSSKVEPVHD